MHSPSEHTERTVFDVVARYILVALFALVPLFIIPVSWSSIAQSKTLLILTGIVLSAALVLIAAARRGSVLLPRSVFLYAVGLLPLAYVASAAMAGFSMHTLIGHGVEQDTVAAVFVWYVLFALAAILMAGNPWIVRAALRTFMGATLLLFVFQILHVLIPSITLGGLLQGPTVNVFGSWHDLGILAGLVVFLAAALWNSSFFNGLWRVVAIAAGAFAFVMLLLVHYADVLWGLVLLSLLSYGVLVRTALKSEEATLSTALIRGVPWGILALACGLLAFFAASLSEFLPDRIAIVEVEVRPSWQGTFDVGREALSAPAALIFGSGPNTFVREWAEHKPAGVNTTPFWESDFNFGVGIIPTSLFTAGLFGAIAWLLMMLAYCALVLRFVRETRPLVTGRLLFGTLLAAAGYLLAFHFMYTPGNGLTMVTFLFLGMLVALSVGDAPPIAVRLGLRTMRELAGIVGVVLIVVLVLVSAGFMGREIVSNVLVNRSAMQFRATGDVGKAGATISRALLISPHNDRAHRAAAELGVVQLVRLMNETDPQNAEAMARLQQTLTTTIQHGLTAVSIDSTNYQNWLLLAQVYSNLVGANIDGAIEAARDAYEKAFEANPTNPLPKLRLAQLALVREDRAQARTYLNEALALKSDFAAVHYLLSQVEAADGNVQAALTAAATTAQLAPKEPLAWFNLGHLLYAAGNYREAALALQQAVALNSEYSNALFILALSYDALDMPEEAVVALRQVRALNPTETWLTNMIENIQAGKEPYAGIKERGRD